MNDRFLNGVLAGLIIILCSLSVYSQGEEPVVNLGTTVTGSQEQPKVLYILPWQPPQGTELVQADFSAELDSLYQPVEREEFLRHLEILDRKSPDTSQSTGDW